MRTATATLGLSGERFATRGAGPAAAFAPPGEVALFAGRSARPALGLSFTLTLGFLVVLLANLALLVPALAAFAPAQALAAAALGALFVERTLARRPFALAWPDTHLLLGFLGVAALSTGTALWPGFAVEKTIELAKLVAVYFLLVNTIEGWRRFELALATLALGALIPAIGAILAFQAGDVVEGRAHWLGIFGNPNDLALALVVLIAPLLAFAANRRGLARAGLVAAAGVVVWAILLSYSRGGMVGLGVVLALVALRWTRGGLRLAAFLLLAAAFLFAVTRHWEREAGFTSLEGDTTFEQRFDTIRAGLAMAADRPLLGVGLGCSVIGYDKYVPAGAAPTRSLQSHNTPVQALAETGILGFALIAGLFVAALRGLRRAARVLRLAGDSRRYRLLTAVEVSLWGFLACGLAGGYLLSWFPYLLLGLASAARRLPAPPGEPARLSIGAHPCAESPAF